MAHTAAASDQSTHDLFVLLHASDDPVSRGPIADQIVESHLSLCDALAGRYRGRGVDHNDLVQVARMALWLAIERYRPDQGSSFASFAIPTITGELKRYFRDHCWMIRPPRHLQELRASAVARRGEWEQSLGRELGVDELAQRMDVCARELRAALDTSDSYQPASLDVAHGDGHGEPIGAQVPSGEDLSSTVIERLALRRAVGRLGHRDRALLSWRFVEECTQREIARRLGVSQMQVSRLIRRILEDLRSDLEPVAAPLAG